MVQELLEAMEPDYEEIEPDGTIEEPAESKVMAISQ